MKRFDHYWSKVRITWKSPGVVNRPLGELLGDALLGQYVPVLCG